MPPKLSFQGVKKKSHNKVDRLCRGLLKVVYSKWPAMASKQGNQMAPRYRYTPQLYHEFRCQYPLVREAERSKVGRSEALGGRAQQQRAVVGHRASGTTSPTPAVFGSLIHCLGPRGRWRGQPWLLAPENKGAAPRAAPIGPGVSSESCSQSAAGRYRATSQSHAPACPACPGTGHGREPGTQVAPRVAVPVNLSHKVKGIYFSGPLPPSPCAILAGRGGAGTDQRPAAVPVLLRCPGL